MDAPKVKRRRFTGQVARTGKFGEVVITRQAIEDIVEQMQTRPTPVNIEHDPTVPPVGRTVDGKLVELGNGECAAEHEFEVFEDTQTAVFVSIDQLLEKQPNPGDPRLRPEKGALEIGVDFRSYPLGALNPLREIASTLGPVETHNDYGRFSAVPDALLVISLTAGSAAFWISKGFFTKVGERLGDEVGQDVVTAYRRFKQGLKDIVGNRHPVDQPPLTMFRLELERPDGGVVEVEGSTRAEGEGLDEFLDAGQDLLLLANAVIATVPQPDRLTKLHFVHEEGQGWRLSYGLDANAELVMVVALPPEDYEQLLAEAKQNSGRQGPGNT